MKYGFSSINPGVSVDESGIQFLQQADVNDPNGPTPFTSPRTSSYVPDTEHNITPIGGIPIPTTSSLSLQADYVEILSSSMSRAVARVVERISPYLVYRSFSRTEPLTTWVTDSSTPQPSRN